MTLSDKAYRIIKKISGDLDDKIWVEDEMRYIDKDIFFLKPSTIFFVTIINIVQIISKIIAFADAKEMSSLVTIILCTLSMILIHFEIILRAVRVTLVRLRIWKEEYKELKKTFSGTVLREKVGFILFCISILIIFI